MRWNAIWREVSEWLVSRWAVRAGLPADRGREFLDWMDGWIAHYNAERSIMRGIEGMDFPAYHARCSSPSQGVVVTERQPDKLLTEQPAVERTTAGCG